jgi:hypothetical protein
VTLSTVATLESKAVSDKVLAAEQHIAVFRLLFSLFSGVIYLLFIDADPQYAKLAWAIMIGGTVYSLYFLFATPYKRIPLLRSSYFTAVGDGIITALWIIATGWMESPFYLVWYLSIISVAARFSAVETAISAIIYLGLYAVIFMYDDHSRLEAAELITRMGFIPLASRHPWHVFQQ